MHVVARDPAFGLFDDELLARMRLPALAADSRFAAVSLRCDVAARRKERMHVLA
jgi:hypothetical protein